MIAKSYSARRGTIYRARAWHDRRVLSLFSSLNKNLCNQQDKLSSRPESQRSLLARSGGTSLRFQMLRKFA